MYERAAVPNKLASEYIGVGAWYGKRDLHLNHQVLHRSKVTILLFI